MLKITTNWYKHRFNPVLPHAAHCMTSVLTKTSLKKRRNVELQFHAPNLMQMKWNKEFT
jgi:hypothetical protein